MRWASRSHTRPAGRLLLLGVAHRRQKLGNRPPGRRPATSVGRTLMRTSRRRVGTALLLLACCSLARAQKESAPYAPPRDVAFRKATIISEGTRLAAELFAPKGSESKALPTIILCHGWG